MVGSANRADGGGSQGGALDDIAQNGPSGGVGGVGLGTGGSMTGLGGLPGSEPGGDSGIPGGVSGGGGGGPFGGVSGGGSSNNSANGSGGECSGSVCTTDTPVGTLFGAIKITVGLYADPQTQGGDCNALWPPKEERQICHYVQNQARPSTGDKVASLFIGDAWALPRDTHDPGNESTKELVCSMQTVQPPMDPNSVPKVGVEALRPFYSSSTDTYKKTLIPKCSPDGKWLAETESVQVPFSPYPESNNTWDFKIDALYPENGTWVSLGTRNLTIKCAWDPTSTTMNIKCEEPAPSLFQSNIQSSNKAKLAE